LTVEEMIRDREKLTGRTRAACGTEMEKLGLIVDSLQIHEIEDPTGYIKTLAMPHAAAVQRDARTAQAEANRRPGVREAHPGRGCARCPDLGRRGAGQGDGARRGRGGRPCEDGGARGGRGDEGARRCVRDGDPGDG
jgi:regulator of protease activity HflC (stomatin/prohibitin superfamily)